ncbi:hypothetical protein EST38_g13745 [Candolleomyces aberdarensis]|uniref:Uncharacterized protein n=1 Tax=Candolleomyces aberdarensis TaxID=2316362 RepID=A0A4V1Q1M5_9AGAR|nr:hypothetical protein EST38_g13745 [Candolleomyces aberdarensis]
MSNPGRSKTHADPARCQEISRMSLVEKMVENAAIKGRNTLKALKRSMVKEKAVLVRAGSVSAGAGVVGSAGAGTSRSAGTGISQAAEDISDDESLISIPEEPDAVPQPELGALEKLTSVLLLAMGKRPASPSSSGDTLFGSKRVRLALAVESSSGIGIKGPVPLDSHGKFTMAKIINPASPGLTQEATMTETQWSFATRTMALWAGEVKSDTVWQQWLLGHFKWVASMRVSGRIDSFETALAFDIDMRMRYHRSAFSFSPERWQSELVFFIQQREVRMRKDIQAEENRSRNRQQRDSNYTSSSGYGDSSKGKKPFRSEQAGGNGTAKVPACPICLTEGHRVGECTATKRSDGKPLYAKLASDGKGLAAVVGGALICLVWNIFGRASPRCSEHGENPALHRCSACGSGDHHALSFACLKRN